VTNLQPAAGQFSFNRFEQAFGNAGALDRRNSTVVLKEQAGALVHAPYSTVGDELAGGVFQRRDDGGEQKVTGPSALSLNTWTYLAATYDGGDAAAVCERNGGGAIVASSGGNTVWNNEDFAGRIDEVRVYNRALSASEIGTDMVTPVGQ
jgi:hypothetical protein